ncbi:MAG: flagellar hook-basal body complex protein FliE [Nocardioidaceae bacterium]
MSVAPISGVGFTPLVTPTVQAPAPAAAGGSDFGSLLAQGLQNLQGLHTQTDQLAVQAATGDLNAIHDYTISATEAAVATQLTTAVRNKALEAFQEIMRMSV